MESITCNKCGSVDDYTITERGVHKTAYCNPCGAYIKNVAYNPPTLYFGQYKGREITSLTSDKEVEYLRWLTVQSFLKPKLKSDIDNYLTTIK